MTITADLFALQEVDGAIEACDRELEQLRGRLGDSETLAAARAALAEAEVRRRAAEARTRDVDGEAAGLAAKIAPVEKRLYDGSVRNPKELQGLQEDLEMLHRQRRALEDRQLEAMEEIEASGAALAVARKEAEAQEGAWRADQGDLLAREQELVQEKTRLTARRQTAQARIDGPQLALYERLRRTRRGVAVVRIERGGCTGCRITLPTTVQQRARSGLQVVQCPSCERILYAG